MEDDEDNHSHVSLISDHNSPHSANSARGNSPVNYKVAAVTVAAVPTTAATLNYSNHVKNPHVMNNSIDVKNSPPPLLPLSIALSIQHSGPINVGGGREDCWSEGATSVLINAWGERYMKLSRGNLKQTHWKEVADIVNSRDDHRKTPKTDIQCKNRIDTVKKKYKVEKAKVASGAGPSMWPFFERLDRLIGPSALAAMAKGSSSSSGAVVASVSPFTASQKVVPMGIPVGVRQHQALPSPYSHTPPQFMRPSFSNATPPIPQPRFTPNYNHNSNPNMNNNSNHGLNWSANANNVGNFGRGVVVPLSVDSDSEGEGWSNNSGNSVPPETGRKRGREEMSGSMREKGRKGKRAEVKEWGNSVRELTRAILKFGEAYEAAERAKVQHIVEMEKERMKFAKELELQKMKFLMKTQLELSHLNENGNSDSHGGGGRRGGVSDVGGGGSNHLRRLDENHVNHANSDGSH